MESHRENGTGKYLEVTLAVLTLLLLILCIFLVREYWDIRQFGIMSPAESFLNLKNRGEPLTANDVGIIQSWMTFEYVNKLFNLPPDYLKTSLSIMDPRYPQLLIFRYAKMNHVDPRNFLLEVRNAVAEYFTSNK